MVKLYKRHPDGHLDYHEAWFADGEITEHWGRVGERGVRRVRRKRWLRDPLRELERVLAEARRAGYAELDEGERRTLLIEYRVEGMGTPADLGRRHQLEETLDEILGWTGLGDCDGGSIGSGTMEACCLVVDFAIARGVIQRELAGTPFGDFTRIYDEDDCDGGATGG